MRFFGAAAPHHEPDCRDAGAAHISSKPGHNDESSPPSNERRPKFDESEHPIQSTAELLSTSAMLLPHHIGAAFGTYHVIARLAPFMRHDRSTGGADAVAAGSSPRPIAAHASPTSASARSSARSRSFSRRSCSISEWHNFSPPPLLNSKNQLPNPKQISNSNQPIPKLNCFKIQITFAKMKEPQAIFASNK